MTPEQVQQIIDAILFLSGICSAGIFAATWKG